MSISDLYSSGFRERNRDHFASIVRVALSDGELTEQEHAFLKRLANNLDIPEGNYEEILENPFAYPVNPPYDHERRLERLYDIARMVYVDEIEDEHELNIMRRLCIGLGFNHEDIDKVIDHAMQLIHEKSDLDTFVEDFRKKIKH
ncbi:TerB family tellurite resistance protein [Robertkochia aurantiaca]|uniref:TerB family tellurite resistance protein n=1 Tax=Robertkochia aurantiaca TaxID=2873700 RepID=UPI001CC9D9FF|nr:TerB family tellurite resistance protein [Robertkochia sp. 3YJGBD-33]